MSSGDSFNDMAFSILQSMRISESRKKSSQTNNTLRLPIYFKN